MGCVRSACRPLSPAVSYERLPCGLLPDLGDAIFEAGLLAAYAAHRLTEDDVARAARVCEDLQRELDILLGPRCSPRVLLVGSCRSGMGLRHADVDVTIVPPPKPDRAIRIDEVAAALAHVDIANSAFIYHTFLSRARVPIIKLTHRASNSDVDVSWDRPENVAMAGLLRVYAAVNPLVQPLIILLKLWAKSNGLLNAPGGYLGGFQLSLMLLYHQQRRNQMPAVPIPGYPTEETLRQAALAVPCMRLKVSDSVLTAQLLDFFTFYRDFDYVCVIDVRLGHGEVTKLNLSDDTGQWWTPVAIVHPITGEAGGNHGGCVRVNQMHEIKAGFAAAAAGLQPSPP